jgi:hypothetical protein
MTTFTLVRAVRGADVPATTLADGQQGAGRTLLPSPAAMDLPLAEELLRLDLGDFVKTVPGTLE